MDIRICKECGINPVKSRRGFLCSRKCYALHRSRVYVGNKHPQWKGGVSALKIKCKACNQIFTSRAGAELCSVKCMGIWQRLNGTKRREKNGMWRGGKYTDPRGYIFLLRPEEPGANKAGYIMEHRLKMQKKIGRPLEKWEVVHHINENKSDNRLKNLRLMTKREHDRMHTTKRHKNIKQFGKK